LGVPLDEEIKAMEIGKGEVLEDGSDIALIAYGNMVQPAMEVAEMLKKEGISVAVINARFVKPLDKGLINKFAAKTHCLFTLEEHSLEGGFGSAVLEALQEDGAPPGTRVKCIGVADIVVEHGAPALIRKDLKLDIQGIYETITGYLSTVLKAGGNGNGKKWFSGNGKKPYVANGTKIAHKVKESVNG
jgi:1-deoxy-D-xylulose-5-phosphate synthase